MDLLEGIRCLALPLMCERIIEVPVRDWLVEPALRKDGSFCIRKSPTVGEDEELGEEEWEETDNGERSLCDESFPLLSLPLCYSFLLFVYFRSTDHR